MTYVNQTCAACAVRKVVSAHYEGSPIGVRGDEA